jgi:hypothetical protein
VDAQVGGAALACTLLFADADAAGRDAGAVFLFYPVEMVPVFFAALADSLKALCVHRKFLGGEIGFTAILHT